MYRFIRECKTEAERQDLRDSMLEHMYYQVLGTRADVADIKKMITEIREVVCNGKDER